MDDQHLKDLKPDGVSDAIRCLICLNTFSGQPVASPQHCDHFYCLTCITEWAKVRLFLVSSIYSTLNYSVLLHGLISVNSCLVIPVNLCLLFVSTWTTLIDAFLYRRQIPAL